MRQQAFAHEMRRLSRTDAELRTLENLIYGLARL